MGRQRKARSARNGQEMCKKGQARDRKGQAGLMYKLTQGENGTRGDHGGSLCLEAAGLSKSSPERVKDCGRNKD